jgi:hypothetical protein
MIKEKKISIIFLGCKSLKGRMAIRRDKGILKQSRISFVIKKIIY